MNDRVRDLLFCWSCYTAWSRPVGRDDFEHCPQCLNDEGQDRIGVFEDHLEPQRQPWMVEADPGALIGEQRWAGLIASAQAADYDPEWGN